MANKIEGWSKNGHAMTRIRAGGGRQLRLTIATADPAVATQRIARLELMARSLTAKGLTREAVFLLRKAAEQTSAEAFELCLQTAASLAPRPAFAAGRPRTFRELGELWTSGELHRLYPDNVKAKRSADDDERLLGHHYRTIGDVPLAQFSIEHYWRAMRNLPPTAVRPMTRRHYAQVITRVLRFAVFPCEVISVYPLPQRDLMPRVVKRDVVFPFLYPDEDLALVSVVPPELPSFCADPETHLLYRVFFGVLDREGMRIDEALGMQWRMQDFRHGVINVGPRKNGRTGTWPAAEGTLDALELLRERVGGEGPFSRLPRDEKYAARLRAMLIAAGVDRHELHHNEPGRRRLRGHDTRSTFVTLRLANGWTEAMVSTNTGHMSSEMVNTYKRQSESIARLGYTRFLCPLDVALGWRVLADGAAPAEPSTPNVPSSAGESGWGETEGETKDSCPGASPGTMAGESRNDYQPVAKIGLEPIRPCGRRILKPPQGPPRPDLQGVGAAAEPPKAPDVSPSEAPSSRPEADPKGAYLAQLRATAHAAVEAGDYAAVAELGKLIAQAGAGTVRAPAEATPAPHSAGASALAEEDTRTAAVVELSSRRRR